MSFDRPAHALLAALVLPFLACGDASGPPEPPEDEAQPAAIQILAGNAQKRAAGKILPDSLAVKVVDEDGAPVAGVSVAWSVNAGGGSVSPASATTGTLGIARTQFTLGAQAGQATVSASVSGIAPVTFSAEALPPLSITAISPDSMVTGGHMFITGAGFGSLAGENQVRINGVTAVVQSAVGSQLTVIVPCLPTGPAVVEVSAFGATETRNHAVRVGDRRNLAVGESYSITGPGARCTELLSAGTYMAVVAHAGSGASTTTMRLRGTTAGAAPPAIVTLGADAMSRRARPGRLAEIDRRHAAHDRILEQNLELIRRLGPMARVPGAAPSAQAAAAAVPNVGDLLSIKVPRYFAPNPCAAPIPVQARVVYVGTRGIVLEDVNSPLAGTIDDMYIAAGQAFDQQQFPILTENFGNPLAFDAQTNADGRIHMLFTKVVNDLEAVAGFVFSGDFYSPAICPATNQMEIFYGLVPTIPGPDDVGSGIDMSAAQWLRTMRTIVIHEAKHITSFAERFARDFPPRHEDLWLEEATAMIAEELYSRQTHGFTHKGNTGFMASLFCERRPNLAQCAGKTYGMYDSFYLLYNYLFDIERLSPLYTDELTYYGSGWSFVRWIVDHYAADEAAFLRALTTETMVHGTDNLHARTGRPFAGLLTDWLLAHALDDHPVYTVDPLYSMPSWDTPDIFRGMNQDSFQGTHPFPTATPLMKHTVMQPSFVVDAPAVRGGTGAVLELSGAAASPRLLELSTTAGGTASGLLTLKVLRVQ